MTDIYIYLFHKKHGSDRLDETNKQTTNQTYSAHPYLIFTRGGGVKGETFGFNFRTKSSLSCPLLKYMKKNLESSDDRSMCSPNLVQFVPLVREKMGPQILPRLEKNGREKLLNHQ